MASDVDIDALLRRSMVFGMLTERVTQLEREVRELKMRPVDVAGNANRCATCGANLRLTGEKPHPVFGVMGGKVREFTCSSCGAKVERDWDPVRN